MKTTNLRGLLNAHQAADALEASHQKRMLELLTTADPFSRSQFEPGHFTASAFVLSPDQQCILLIFHSKLHLWLQPGGHVDPEDSSLIAAAKREVAEETGLTAVTQIGAGLFDLDVHGIPANTKKAEPSHAHFDARILLQSHTLDFEAGSDALAARWTPLGDFLKPTDIETDESVMRAIRKVNRRLGH